MNKQVFTFFTEELLKIAEKTSDRDDTKKSDNRKKMAIIAGGLLSAALLGKGYKTVFPKNPGKGPMHSINQALDNEGPNFFTIGKKVVSENDTRRKQQVMDLGGYLTKPVWSTDQKVDGFPLVELKKGEQGTWAAHIASMTKDNAGRMAPVLIKQERAGMFTNKQKEEFAREAYEYAKKMHTDLEFPKWKGS